MLGLLVMVLRTRQLRGQSMSAQPWFTSESRSREAVAGTSHCSVTTQAYAGVVRPPVLAEVLRGSLPAFVQNWSCVVGFMVSPGTD